MTTPPTIQINPLDPVFSGVPVTFPQTGTINPTWDKWFVDLREKVNVINATLAAWSGITPGSVTAGTYGDTTHYPIVTVNAFGVVTGISQQSTSGGGGNPIHINTVTSNYTVAASDIPAASSYRGMVVTNVGTTNLVTIDTFANTSIPVGADLLVGQIGAGATTIEAATGVTLIGPSIAGGGVNSIGRAVQILQDTWLISGNLAFSSGGDPYWANVTSLMHFNGTNGGTTFTDQVAGNTWTSTPAGITTSTAQSKFNGSSLYIPSGGPYHLAGSSSIANCFLGVFTIEVWVYVVAYDPTYATLVCNCDKTASPRGMILSLSATNHYLQIQNVVAGTSVVSTTAVPLNAWHFLTWSYDGSTVYLFMDGTLVASGGIAVLASNPGNTFNWGSEVDNIIHSNMYLAEGRVTKGICRYTTNFTPPTAPFPNS